MRSLHIIYFYFRKANADIIAQKAAEREAAEQADAAARVAES
ncbi:hypothetical protein [Muricomes intestini]|nr:hypothetical protein [Muricomes intestini]